MSAARIEEEIKAFHAFLQGWFNGTLEAAEFSRLEDVLAGDFVLIGPSSRELNREELLNYLRPKRGENAGNPGIVKAIDFRYRRDLGQGVHLVTYEEWQAFDERKTNRITTAIMREKEGMPHGIEWLHLHETWKPV